MPPISPRQRAPGDGWHLYGSRGRTTLQQEHNMRFREVLARDMRDIRSNFGPEYNQGLKDLLDYYRENLPLLIEK